MDSCFQASQLLLTRGLKPTTGIDTFPSSTRRRACLLVTAGRARISARRDNAKEKAQSRMPPRTHHIAESVAKSASLRTTTALLWRRHQLVVLSRNIVAGPRLAVAVGRRPQAQARTTATQEHHTVREREELWPRRQHRWWSLADGPRVRHVCATRHQVGHVEIVRLAVAAVNSHDIEQRLTVTEQDNVIFARALLASRRWAER